MRAAGPRQRIAAALRGVAFAIVASALGDTVIAAGDVVPTMPA